MYAALAERNLRKYLIGNLLSIMGTWAQRVVVFWLAWELTGSTTILGTMAALDLAPSLVASPLAGVWAERRSASQLATTVQLLSALPPVILIGFALADQITIALLLIMTFVTGLLSGFDHPLRLLLVGSVVSRENLSAAIALNSISFNIGRMIGPAFGGWMISTGHISFVFMVNVASFILFALVLARIQIKNYENKSHSVTKSSRHGSWPTVFQKLTRFDRWLFYYFAVLGLMVRPIFELMPSLASRFASEALTEAKVYSVLTSTQGIGALVGAVITTIVLTRFTRQWVATLSGMVSALGLFGFLLSPFYLLAIVALAILSGAMLTNGISTQVMLQTRLPAELRGRALALYTMTLRGTPALGALIIGCLGEVISQEIIFSISVAVLLVGGLTMVRHIGIAR